MGLLIFGGTAGSVFFTIYFLEKAIQNGFKLKRESVTGQIKDISIIEEPIVYQLANPSFSLERFSKSKFYNQIKEIGRAHV